MFVARSFAFAVVALAALAWAPPVQAQKTDVETLFQALRDGTVEPQVAMRTYLAGTPLKDIDDKSFETIASNLGVMKSKIGKILDSELVETKEVGRSVTIYKYLLKGDASVSVWTFIYYRPPRVDGTTSAAQLLHVAFQTDVLALDEITPTTR